MHMYSGLAPDNWHSVIGFQVKSSSFAMI